MEKQFQLISPNPAKALLLLLLGITVMVGSTFAGVIWLPYGDAVRTGWMLLTLGGGGYVTYHLVENHVGTPLTVTVRTDALHLLWTRTGLEKTVAYRQILAYQVEAFSGGEALRLRLDDSTKVRIVISSDMHGDQSLAGLVGYFEECLQAYQPPAGTTAPLREKSFFERTAATVLLVVMGAVVLAYTWAIITLDKPVGSTPFLVYPSFITYAVSWYWARNHELHD